MPGLAFRLKDGVLTPLELLEQWDSYAINSEYYTSRHVNAALQRCFGLPPFKISIQAWYNSCPKPKRRIHHWPTSRSATSSMLSSFFGSDTCAICGNRCKSTGSSRVVVCHHCRMDNTTLACTALDRLKTVQQQASQLAAVCSKCNGCLESFGTFAREESRTLKQRENSNAGKLSLSSRRGGRLCTPIANCVCIDCPITYERHKIRESEIEATELCHALDLCWHLRRESFQWLPYLEDSCSIGNGNGDYNIYMTFKQKIGINLDQNTYFTLIWIVGCFRLTYLQVLASSTMQPILWQSNCTKDVRRNRTLSKERVAAILALLHSLQRTKMTDPITSTVYSTTLPW